MNDALFTDTTCGPESESSSWESMYKLLEDEKPYKIQRIETIGTPDSFEATTGEVTNSFLHRIPTRPKILPYNGMVRFVIDNLNIGDRTFLTSRGTIIGSFKAEDLKVMYHLLDPEKVYDKEFIAHFTK